MKSTVKRVKDNKYYYWSDEGTKEYAYDNLHRIDDYRHDSGNYFARTDDVIDPNAEIECFTADDGEYGEPKEEDKPFDVAEFEDMDEPQEEEEEEKFVQIEKQAALTNKGRIFSYGSGEWAILPIPDFKNIK